MVGWWCTQPESWGSRHCTPVTFQVQFALLGHFRLASGAGAGGGGGAIAGLGVLSKQE